MEVECETGINELISQFDNVKHDLHTFMSTTMAHRPFGFDFIRCLQPMDQELFIRGYLFTLFVKLKDVESVVEQVISGGIPVKVWRQIMIRLSNHLHCEYHHHICSNNKCHFVESYGQSSEHVFIKLTPSLRFERFNNDDCNTITNNELEFDDRVMTNEPIITSKRFLVRDCNNNVINGSINVLFLFNK